MRESRGDTLGACLGLEPRGAVRVGHVYLGITSVQGESASIKRVEYLGLNCEEPSGRRERACKRQREREGKAGEHGVTEARVRRNFQFNTTR